ncbi:transglycosylase SLT domain-containing protein [Devosia sp. CN2-171]|uniref:transglycosylase SLT domain-containing protein n=1 Tax=Devosia sp. CN2-171 TaxID=3400909 RepID=UPI003BF804C9
MKPISVPQPLAYAIDTAGAKSDVDFDYLLQTAIRESSLNPEAKAQTSSATGLFQFLDSTWLQVMRQEGPRLGYQQYADAIRVDKDGDYYIADKALRADILALREDPQVSADLAAAFTRSNGEYLFEKFGRMPSPGELYIAHFLGPQGAEKMFNAGLSDPDQIAADLFPKQAKANRAIFYENGTPRTIREVYRALVDKHDGQFDPLFSAQQMASDPTGKWPAAATIPSRFSADDMSFTSLFSNEGEVQGRVLLSPASEAQGAALFTQLYGQGK